MRHYDSRLYSLKLSKWGEGGVKISSSVQPVDLCYFSFSFNRVFF